MNDPQWSLHSSQPAQRVDPEFLEALPRVVLSFAQELGETLPQDGFKHLRETDQFSQFEPPRAVHTGTMEKRYSKTLRVAVGPASIPAGVGTLCPPSTGVQPPCVIRV